ncbi:tetratricopeptide repeat protein [uncultured Methanospirillum sp.]|uniref:tetratricopeptide repeat protein n=1 Tax=uncultured Methanospirillum sp. TaxID=262503 RepID=UPI0029C6111A|nr:tetratricopeptide repeat protein [uncultured Methanospirillum sp.]
MKMLFFFLLICLCSLDLVIPSVLGTGPDLFATGDYNGALKAFQNELSATTGAAQAPVLSNIGTCYMALGKPDLAEENYAKAVSVDPGYGRGWINLGVSQEKLGKLEEALNSYGRVSDSGDLALIAEANVKKGTLLASKGRFDEAITAFESAEGNAKGSVAVDLYTGIGGADFMKGDIPAAEMAFLNAIEIDPSGAAMAYTNLGVIRITQKRYTEAKSAFETAIHNDPQGKTKAAQYLQKLQGMGVL